MLFDHLMATLGTKSLNKHSFKNSITYNTFMDHVKQMQILFFFSIE